MTEIEETQEKRRAPSVRYPGSALPRVAQVLTFLDEVGGTASLGSLAGRVNLSEKNADFVRLVASARAYGLADWGNASRSVVRLTEEGGIALHGDEDERQGALARAFLRAPVFARVARKFEGRGLPAGAGLVEPFKLEGVAESAAPLAAKNFIESAVYAGLVEEHSGRQVLTANLPYPPEEAAPRPAAAISAPAPRPASGRSVTATTVPFRSATGLPNGGRSAGGVTINVKLDLSGWDVDRVVELVERLNQK